MMEPLFKDIFPTADKSAWLAQVRKELKEENAYETLRWHTDDGFVAEPYYTTEDLAALLLTEIKSKRLAGLTRLSIRLMMKKRVI